MRINPIEYLAPRYRNTKDALLFAHILAAELDCLPGSFGQDYAWDAPIPPADRMHDEAKQLAEHLASLG